MDLSAARIAALTGGAVSGAPDARAISYANDSRALRPGACFVALVAERDGHEFVADAFARGATVALVGRDVGAPRDGALVVVDDPLAALARLAAAVRAEQPDLTVVGITGSAGKTATKDLTAAALAGARAVSASPGSFNNEAGLPLTLLGAPVGTEVVVAEMGARFPGNIADLCAIARPRVGVVTHIGLSHAEHLGGREGIARTKGELVEALPDTGYAVLNADDDTTPGLAARTSAGVVTVGEAPTADVVVRSLRLDAGLRPTFTLESPWGAATVTLGLRGAHQACNAAMGVTVALLLGVPIDVAVADLGTTTTADWRMELLEAPGGIVVLNDAYNASPSSMQASLRAFGALPVTGRRIAVLGDMLELGECGEAEHARVGELAAAVGVDLLVTVGTLSRGAVVAAGEAGIEALAATDRDDARAILAATLRPGDAVLVKASRAVGLEVIAGALARGELVA